MIYNNTITKSINIFNLLYFLNFYKLNIKWNKLRLY